MSAGLGATHLWCGLCPTIRGTRWSRTARRGAQRTASRARAQCAARCLTWATRATRLASTAPRRGPTRFSRRLPCAAASRPRIILQPPWNMVLHASIAPDRWPTLSRTGRLSACTATTSHRRLQRPLATRSSTRRQQLPDTPSPTVRGAVRAQGSGAESTSAKTGSQGVHAGVRARSAQDTVTRLRRAKPLSARTRSALPGPLRPPVWCSLPGNPLPQTIPPTPWWAPLSRLSVRRLGRGSLPLSQLMPRPSLPR
mmetsp:Transcript_8831/g.21849  ORF Transcript_8831/g.21849 Transcript_8831/m.21849 type:complete len:255 (+) Transcript_8831:7943-8707(+)